MFKFLLFWSIAVISFIVIGGILVINALGYRVNWHSWSFQKTGLIDIESNPVRVQVYVDGKLIGTKTPLNIPGLFPSMYDIEIKSANYQSWDRTVRVDPGNVTALRNVILFLKDPKLEPGTPRDLELINNKKPSNDLGINGSELYLLKNNQPELITRFSQTIVAGELYPDKKHVAYQIDKEIAIAEIDGRNPETLVKLDSNDPVTMLFTNNGSVLLVKQKDSLYRISIR